MKLRNKKDRENGQLNTIEFDVDYDKKIDVEILLTDTYGETINKSFRSLDELKQYLDEWEDYTPQEPLIKDENIRKAVRAWADANYDITEVYYDKCKKTFGETTSFKVITVSELLDDNLQDNGVYTIAELCGEENNEN